ncbi:MAG TPA: AAA family ATPase [Candidatus Saccharimonadales bacterium]|nr:AAA family ATPase [Candidatus Saccharimonadales bacterium]
MAYQLSPDQIEALQTIGRWYRTRSAPFLTLGGYAGTGKTTMAAYVRQALRQNDPDVRVAFCAFTGKAVRVLEQTLKAQGVSRRGDSVGTIHSLIYTTELDAGGHVTRWHRRAELKADLIIVDEASMVTEELWQDLLSFKLPILAIGDHGQLPPVGGQFNLMAEPQIRLERVYRQVEDSPIVEVATLARTTGQIPPGRYGPTVIKYDRAGADIGSEMEELLEAWRAEWLVLCGYNHTRVRLNQSLRAKLGFELPNPVAGDHVICLRNNASAKLYNGMTGTISDIQAADDDPEQLWWQAAVHFDDRDYAGYLLREQFGARETVSPVPPPPGAKAAKSGKRGQPRGDLFDFGYALTVHKAQGSSADTVLLFEERNKHMSDDDWRRWLYTAVTRAERQLFIIGD